MRKSTGQLFVLFLQTLMFIWLLKCLIVTGISIFYITRGRPKYIYEWIVIFGSIGRGLGATQMLTAPIFILIALIHYVPERLFHQDLEETEAIGLSSFMDNYHVERLQLSRKIVQLLCDIQNSTLVHLKKLTSNDKKPEVASKKSEVNSEAISHHLSVLIRELQLQYQHLEHLKQHQSSIWPGIRTHKWHLRMVKIYLLAQVAMTLSVWVFSVFGSVVGLFMTHEILENNQNLELQYRRFMWPERVECAMIIIYMWLSLDWHVLPAVFCTCGFVDRMVHLAELKGRFASLMGDMLSFNRSLDQKLDGKTPRKRTSIKAIGEVKWLFDQRSIELYVALQIFCWETRTMFRRTRVYVIYGTLLILCVSVLIFALMIVENYKSRLWDMVLVFIIVNVNAALYPCAKFCQLCNGLIRAIYSLNALNESFDRRFGISTSSEWKHRTRGGLNNGLDNRGPDLHLMTPHTAFLWRRFISDLRFVLDIFTCKLVGNKRVNIKTVMQVNFFLASAVMLMITRRIF